MLVSTERVIGRHNLKYFFYYKNSNSDETVEIDEIDTSMYEVSLWRPGLINVLPHRLSHNPFAVWWLFHQFRIFSNRDYAILLISYNDILVHRSVIYPKYFRFPFMAEGDLQIGDTSTNDEFRGKGIATFAVCRILELYKDRKLWYVTDKANQSSIRVIEKAGFVKYGEGVRTKRFGMNIFGSFIIN